MTRISLIPMILCLYLAVGGSVGIGQERLQNRAELFESPFDRQPAPKTIKKKEPSAIIQSTAAAEMKLIRERFPGLTGDKIEKLIKKNPADDKVRALMKERCQVAFLEVAARLMEYQQGNSPVTNVLRSAHRLVSSLLALAPDDSTRMAILNQNVEIAREIEKYTHLNLKNGTGTIQEYAQAKYERLSAEILLEEEKIQKRSK